MEAYRLGARGPEVADIQRKLAAAGQYQGAIDGAFGGGTQAAVTAFQRRHQLAPNGTVDAPTWSALFATDIAPPAITQASLALRCLAMTGSFETGAAVPECFCGISGDFDGQGLSFGVLQWNFGQGSLQPLLQEMVTRHRPVVEGIFGPHLEALEQALEAGHDDLMAFARSVQHPVQHTVFEPWRGLARALGRTPEFQEIQTEHAKAKFDTAVALRQDYGLWSERAVALLFDIVTQNGSISPVVRARIRADLANLPASLSTPEREVQAMEVVANRRAEAANPRWIDDVRSRKLCIARGEGTVHGIRFDLEAQFGIGLRRYPA